MKLVKLLSDYFVIKDGDTTVASTESTDNVQKLSLLKIKELIGEPRSRELFLEDLKNRDIHPLEKLGTMKGFMLGWGLCEGENQDKKYTEKDLRKAMRLFHERELKTIDDVIQSLQPRTEWDVEFVDGELRLI